jgi:1,2-phenylacetyl-CoA epoxidase catalytic subunit
MIEALANGNVEVLRGRLRKMLQEERYHSLHGRSWMHEVKAGAALDRAWRESVEWIGPEPIRRRTQTGGIDQATLDMLQGLAEKRYMPASG